MKSKICILFVAVILCLCCCTACDMTSTPEGSTQDKLNQKAAANELQANQPTPTDIEYSLERYNLIRRAYWVNGQREKALTLPCPVSLPEGHIVLLSESGAVVAKFLVQGKVSSLNSYLTPDSDYYEYSGGGSSTYKNQWLADVDGSYGTNDNGIFFFTKDGKYIEWTGTYLYSDIPFKVADPVVKYEGQEIEDPVNIGGEVNE